MAEKVLPPMPPQPGPPPPGPVVVPPWVPDALYYQLGQPPAQRIYVSTQGDWWDLIAIRVYGRVRGYEHLMYRLLEANYHLRHVAQFPAGVAVVVPDVPVIEEIPLVPWKATTAIPPSG